MDRKWTLKRILNQVYIPSFRSPTIDSRNRICSNSFWFKKSRLRCYWHLFSHFCKKTISHTELTKHTFCGSCSEHREMAKSVKVALMKQKNKKVCDRCGMVNYPLFFNGSSISIWMSEIWRRLSLCGTVRGKWVWNVSFGKIILFTSSGWC